MTYCGFLKKKKHFSNCPSVLVKILLKTTKYTEEDIFPT